MALRFEGLVVGVLPPHGGVALPVGDGRVVVDFPFQVAVQGNGGPTQVPLNCGARVCQAGLEVLLPCRGFALCLGGASEAFQDLNEACGSLVEFAERQVGIGFLRCKAVVLSTQNLGDVEGGNVTLVFVPSLDTSAGEVPQRYKRVRANPVLDVLDWQDLLRVWFRAYAVGGFNECRVRDRFWEEV